MFHFVCNIVIWAFFEWFSNTVCSQNSLETFAIQAQLQRKLQKSICVTFRSELSLKNIQTSRIPFRSIRVKRWRNLISPASFSMRHLSFLLSSKSRTLRTKKSQCNWENMCFFLLRLSLSPICFDCSLVHLHSSAFILGELCVISILEYSSFF